MILFLLYGISMFHRYTFCIFHFIEYPCFSGTRFMFFTLWDIHVSQVHILACIICVLCILNAMKITYVFNVFLYFDYYL